MESNEQWEAFKWHCVNCGEVVVGIRNQKGDIKAMCPRCRTAMVRILKKANKNVIINVFTPSEQEYLQLRR